MRMARSIVLIILVVAARASAFDQKPPLVIDFIVDPDVRQRFASDQDLRATVEDTVMRASLIFHANIGRRLRVGNVRIGLPPGVSQQIFIGEALAWLVKNNDGKGNFLVFLSGRPIFLYDGYSEETGKPVPRYFSGYADFSGQHSLVIFSSDSQRAALILLHELGHNCGAGHSEDQLSIMYENNNHAATPLSFKEYASRVREQCG